MRRISWLALLTGFLLAWPATGVTWRTTALARPAADVAWRTTALAWPATLVAWRTTALARPATKVAWQTTTTKVATRWYNLSRINTPDDHHRSGRHFSVRCLPCDFSRRPSALVRLTDFSRRPSALVRLTGAVINGATRRPVGGVPVTLDVVRGDRPVTVARTRSDARGRFTLDAPSLAGGGYVAVATYRGVPYGVPVGAMSPARALTLPVYDTTSSDNNLIAPLVQIGMTRTAHGLQVAEEWTVVNPTSVTDVGGDTATGRGSAFLPVPPGASNVQVQPGDTSIDAPATVERGAVSMNTVIRPATGRNAASFHRVKFAFTLPYGPGHPTLRIPTLRIPTRYLIGSLEVFALGSRLYVPGFSQTALDVGKSHVPGWKTEAVAPNTTTSIGVDGPPAALPPVGPVGPPPFPFASVAILAGGGFALLLLLGLTGRAPVPVAEGDAGGGARAEPPGRLRRERARLVSAIAELDLQYARGRVSPARYQRRRAREKDRLLAIARRLGR